MEKNHEWHNDVKFKKGDMTVSDPALFNSFDDVNDSEESLSDEEDSSMADSEFDTEDAYFKAERALLKTLDDAYEESLEKGFYTHEEILEWLRARGEDV